MKSDFEYVIYDDDKPDYDREAIEKSYNLEEGYLDDVDIRSAEKIVGEEEGALDRYLWDEDNERYVYQQQEFEEICEYYEETGYVDECIRKLAHLNDYNVKATISDYEKMVNCEADERIAREIEYMVDEEYYSNSEDK